MKLSCLKFLLLVLACLAFTACGEMEQLISLGKKITPSLNPTQESFQTPSLVLPSDQSTIAYRGWTSYTNDRYGFSFLYPPTWKLEDGPHILKLSQGVLELVIGFKVANEPAKISSASPGAGDLQSGGSAVFLGQELPKTVLVYQNRVKAVYYKGYSAEIPASPESPHILLVFNISLYDMSSNYLDINIPPASQAEVDSIIASFEYSQAISPASALLGIHAEAQDTFTYFTTCIDLDEGRKLDGSSPGCDFSVYSGGDYMKVEFAPFFPAAFAFNSMLLTQPTLDQCMGLKGMSSDTLTITPQNHFICYQTKNGRYGYLTFKEIDPYNGITFDWRTFEAAKLKTEPLSRNDSATFVMDVTIPDGTELQGGETFTKTWELLNSGESTWTTAYALVFDRGDPMGITFEVPLPHDVPSGQTIDISIELTAPHHRGDYTGWWKLRNADGIRFGSGQGAGQPFYVMIKVTRSAIHTPTPSLTTTTPPPPTPETGDHP